MFTPLKFCIILSALSLLVLIIYPLAVFIYDFLQDPECLKVEVEGLERLDNETRVRVNIYYCSRVPLRSLKLTIGEEVVSFDTITQGSTSKIVLLSVEDVEVKSVELEIAGLYKFVLQIR